MNTVSFLQIVSCEVCFLHLRAIVLPTLSSLVSKNLDTTPRRTLSSPMESEIPPVISLEQRKDFAETEAKLESSKVSSVADDAGETNEKAEGLQSEQSIRDEHVYLTGVKLVVVLASVTLVFFLVLLDMSIISTVRSDRIELSYRSY